MTGEARVCYRASFRRLCSEARHQCGASVRFMRGSAHPVLESVLRSALEATGATQGWVLATDGNELVVTALAGAEDALLGQRVGANVGFAGYVAASGQPLAMSPRRDDPRGAEGVVALVGGGHPSSVLAVPCVSHDSVNGVMELVTKHGGGPFTFDDVEIATLLGDVAGAVLASDVAAGAAVPSPRELGDDLVRLAATDPTRYAALATFLASVLRDG